MIQQRLLQIIYLLSLTGCITLCSCAELNIDDFSVGINEGEGTTGLAPDGENQTIEELLFNPETSIVPPISLADIQEKVSNIDLVKEVNKIERLDSASAGDVASVSGIPETGKLNLTITSAISTALKNNHNIVSESLQPAITQTQEAVARAAFDPSLKAKVQKKFQDQDYTSSNSLLTESEDLGENTTEVEIGLQEYLPTGTQLELGYELVYDYEKAKYSALNNSTYQNTTEQTHTFEFTVTQRLLRGFGLDTNLARLRQARINTDISYWQFYGYVENFVAQVETDAWDYIYAIESARILQSSLKLAETDYEDTLKMIARGKQAVSAKYAPLSRIAQTREQLVEAMNSVNQARLNLLQLISPSEPDYWTQDIDITFDLIPDNDSIGICGEHIALALDHRPDIRQAMLQIKTDELEVVYTKNGLLPELDFFASAGWSTYSQTVTNYQAQNSNNTGKQYAVGLSLDYNFGSRQERAEYQRAQLTHAQAKQALQNQKTLVIKDVTTAYANLRGTLGNIKNYSLTRIAMNNNYEAEKKLLRGGKTTTYQVAQALDDLVESQLSELEAVIEFRKALIQMFLSDSSILQRRGIYLHSPKK